MSKVILIAGASSGLGTATAQVVAGAGHIAYLGTRSASGGSAGDLVGPDDHPRTHRGQIHPVVLDIADQHSVSAAVSDITAAAGRIDVVIHTMGPVPLGPVESFTPYQLAQIYDAHVLSTQRVNRAVLPQMRERRDGLLIWAVTSRQRADTVPYFALHSAAVAAIDRLGSSYGRELLGFGVETTIVYSGLLMPDPAHHQRMIFPDDTETMRAYEHQYPGLFERLDLILPGETPIDASVRKTARAIMSVVDSPKGSRPTRVTAGMPNSRLESGG